ncbi:P-loop containing nucleoside triphosphate hydrolases superfamily protein [Rhynchospora pubera]|uniref:P-loop containing nucleoside triphosphate hydrolases superfamily protein n=1 Tax=Rhynchospora pubera TaxID=906938 RepID=A0AAV8HHS6_9POAL|nr:P-loop containing nucleoside triphosphate hydrolases superfamily protein [Rhynchospora pubera]
MAPDSLFAISAASLVEDVLRQHSKKLSDRDLASRKAEDIAIRRYEAAGWLRRTVGVVSAKDLPEAPSEEEFRIGLRNGLILCNALNKVHPGAVPKVVVNPGDPVLQPDGAALSAFQYFENVRNFLVAVQELGIPTFEASDLEQGGKGARVVNCVLAMKSYSEWKKMGATGSWKYGGIIKPLNLGKSFLKRNSEQCTNSLSRSLSMNECEILSDDHSLCGNSSDSNELVTTRPLRMLVNAALSDKRPDEVPMILESVLSKLVEELDNRMTSQSELVKSALKGSGSKSFSKSKVSSETTPGFCEQRTESAETYSKAHNEKNKEKTLRQHSILEQQQNDIEELRKTLRTTKAGFEFMQMKYTEEINTLGLHIYGLANAASGYHKVLEENRKLYNQVQDLKGSIRVYCRVRPFLPGQLSSNTVGSIDEGNITILTPSKHGKEARRTFCFNKVFGPSSTQDEVFLDTQPLIRSVLDGYNVCIFAYGQTGSGKTFTMSGPKNATERTQGVNFRALGDLFKLADQRKGMFIYEIAVQMIEIYNEQVRDLLVSDGFNKRLEIRNNSQNGINVPDASLVRVTSTSDVMELMNIGLKNRAVGSTALNDRSSRSHSCVTVHVQGRDLTAGTILRGCMHLVDLAGSERVDKSEVTGERLKEAQHINKSLSALGDVIAALAQKSSHVPYRNSKLTQLLQDSLGGQAKTLMFVHISPEFDAIGETISTLKFAERVSTVELGAAKLNKETGEVRDLKEQIARLKSELAIKDGGGSGHTQSTFSNPEVLSTRASSPLISERRHDADFLSRQPMEEVGNIEVRNTPPFRQKKLSFDLNDFSRPNFLSSDMNLRLEPEDKEVSSGEWIDKVVVNTATQVVRGVNWEEDTNSNSAKSEALPSFFYQRYQPSKDSKHFRRKESVDLGQFYMNNNTDESDDLDVATSDSSEADMLWQFNMPNVSVNASFGANTESASKIKKPQVRLAERSDMRTPTQSHIPLPSSRKMSNGSSRSNGKRTSSNGKLSTK